MISFTRSASAALLTIAGIAFCLAAMLNIASILQYAPVEAMNPNIIAFSMTPLMFVMVIVMIRIQRDTPDRKAWQILWTISPRWAKPFCYGLLAYGIIIWLVLAGTQHQTGKSSAPMPFLSAWAMTISFMAVVTFYTLWRQPTLLMGVYCKNGHRVSPMDKFCPQCGAAL